MSRGQVIAVCFGLVACVPEPTFKGMPRDADPDADADAGNTGITCMPTVSDVSVNRQGIMDRGANVCGPGYQMVFSDLGAHMPYQLNVGGMQLMGGAQFCNDERGTGVALYPTALVNGENHEPSIVAGELTTPLTGPVIVKVAIDWSVGHTCGGGGTLEDRSAFTFFPDGHVTRVDRLSQAQQTAATGCGVCGSGGVGPNFFLTSYTTLQAPPGSQLTGALITDLVTYDQTATGLRSACLRTLSQNVAFGWRNGSTRIRVANTTPRTLAFVQDVVTSNMLGPNFADNVTTHMLLSSTTACGPLDALARRWSDRPEIFVQGNPIGPSLDGIYGGENDSGETAIMTSIGDKVITLEDPGQRVPGGWAVWLDFGGEPNNAVQVLLNGTPAPGESFRMQRVNGKEIIFWFRDELVDGTVITIVPG